MVELMVAIGVLLVAVMSAFSSQLTSLNLTKTSSETKTAITDLQTAMEELLLEPAAGMPLVGEPFEAGVPLAAFADLHLQDEQIVPSYPGYTPGNPVPDPLQITLTVTWSDYAGRARSLDLSTVKAR